MTGFRVSAAGWFGIDGVAANRVNNPDGEQDYVDVYATAGPNDSVLVVPRPDWRMFHSEVVVR